MPYVSYLAMTSPMGNKRFLVIDTNKLTKTVKFFGMLSQLALLNFDRDGCMCSIVTIDGIIGSAS